MEFQLIESELRHRKSGWWHRVLKAIPELADLAVTPQPIKYHAEGDVAVHTRMAVEACPADCDPDLLWAALLHDIGKPLTTVGEGDKITAHGHQAVGAEITEKLLERLAMPPARRKRIVWAVRHHTFHLSWNLQAPEKASRRHKRFVADPDFPLLLELLRADSAATSGDSRKMQTYHLYRRLKEKVMADEPRRSQRRHRSDDII